MAFELPDAREGSRRPEAHCRVVRPADEVSAHHGEREDRLEQVVRRSLDEAAYSQLIDDYIDRVGS